MRRSESIKKLSFKEIVPPVFGDIKTKPKLLVPFVVSFFVLNGLSVFFSLLFSLFLYDHVIKGESYLGIWFIDESLGTMGFFYLWKFLTILLILTISIIFSGWSIINYWTYIRTGDFSLMRSLRKVFKYFWKMLAASILASLILFIPINLPEFLFYILVMQNQGQDFTQRWHYDVNLLWAIWSSVWTTLFVFIYHGIIIEKKGIGGSLYRSFKVSTQNYFLIFFILISPLLLAIPFMALGQLLYSTGEPLYTVSNLIKVLIPFIISIVLGPIITFSIIRSFIVSVMRSRSGRDKWGFET